MIGWLVLLGSCTCGDERPPAPTPSAPPSREAALKGRGPGGVQVGRRQWQHGEAPTLRRAQGIEALLAEPSASAGKRVRVQLSVEPCGVALLGGAGQRQVLVLIERLPIANYRGPLTVEGDWVTPVPPEHARQRGCEQASKAIAAIRARSVVVTVPR